MANTCITTYRVTGSLKAVKDLWNTIQAHRQGNNVWLHKLADHYGIDYQARHISVRGFIFGASIEPGRNLISFETETAWNACDELFDAVNQALDGELSVSFREVEPGLEVYYVHDEGAFFPEKCYVCAYGGPFGDDTEGPYESMETAIETWCERTGIERGNRGESEMLEFINEFEYEDEDVYYYINFFKYI